MEAIRKDGMMDDFYLIPGFSGYAISKNGIVLNVLRMKILNGSVNPAGYHNFRLRHDGGYTFTIGRHRILALTFIPKKIDERFLVVNHKNGIKGDDRLENLEWVTYQENQFHAGLNGLTTKCCPMLAKNSLTGEILVFFSIKQCAETLGLTKDQVVHRLKYPDTRIFPEGFQYRIGHDGEDWETSVVEPGLPVGEFKKSIYVKNLFTLEIKYFKRLKELADLLEISPSVLTGWLKDRHQPVLPGLLQVKFSADNSPWRVVDDPLKEIAETLKTKLIKVTDSKTGDVRFFTSLKECAEALNLKINTVFYRLHSTRKSPFSDGFHYEYYS